MGGTLGRRPEKQEAPEKGVVWRGKWGGGRFRVGRISRRVWKPECEMLPEKEASRSL